MKKYALLGLDASDGTKALLQKYGYDVIRLPRNPNLSQAVSAHPDLSLFFAKDFLLTTRSYYGLARAELDFASHFLGLPIKTTAKEAGDKYPDDILLDALPVGRRLFCLPEHTAEELTASASYEIIPVKQGYAKCSALPVGGNALVTADPSILRSAERAGIETFRIREGFVRLDGCANGFIGGATSYAPYGNTDKIFFSGDLSAHPDCKKMTEFLSSHGFEAIYASGEPLRDVGTIFLL